MTAQLGTLVLQPVPEPPFLRPNDPVAMVQGAGRSYAHGEDGRFSEDGGLYCRFTGQTLASLTVTGTTAPVTATTLGLAAVTVPDAPAEVADLATEAFFLDPANAHAIAAAADPTSPQPDSVVEQQLTLFWDGTGDPSLDQQTSAGAAGLSSAYGPVALPSMVAVGYWAAPWSPLYLDWSGDLLRGALSGHGVDLPGQHDQHAARRADGAVDRQPAPDGWRVLAGQGPAHPAGHRRARRPPGAAGRAGRQRRRPGALHDRHQRRHHLPGHADVLSQALSGFTDLLLQRDPTLVQQPDLTTLGQWLAPPGGPAFTPTAAPSPASGVPLSPVRAGFLSSDKLWVVDDFGQYFDVLGSMTGDPQAGAAETGPDLAPTPQAGLARAPAPADPAEPPAAAIPRRRRRHPGGRAVIGRQSGLRLADPQPSRRLAHGVRRGRRAARRTAARPGAGAVAARPRPGRPRVADRAADAGRTRTCRRSSPGCCPPRTRRRRCPT